MINMYIIVCIYIYTYNWLVVYLPLYKNMISSVGMMKFAERVDGKTQNVPNQQAAKRIQNA